MSASPTSTGELKVKVAADKTKAALSSVAQGVKQGVTTATDAMQPSLERFKANLINILGEQVSLIPSGLSPQEQAIVEFDSYYVPPQLQKEEIVILKNTMRALFDNTPKEITDTGSGKELDKRETETYPPCGDYEKALVLASLLYRARKLRQQLYEQGILNREQLAQRIAELDQAGREKSIQGRDTAIARTELEHLYDLQKFIDTYDKQQKCIDIGEIAYKDIGLELTDEQIETLLRQFIFFILQTKYPLKEFQTKDPTASGFVRRLQKRKVDFDPYVSAYTKAGQTIPPPIAKVLDSIKGNNELLQKEIARQVDIEKQKIFKSIASKFPDGDPLLKTLEATQDPALLIDRLRMQIKETSGSFKGLEAEKTRLQQNVKSCDEAKAALQAQMRRIEEQVNSFKKQAEGKAQLEEQLQQVEQSKTAALDALNKRIAEVEAQRDALQTRLNVKDAEIARLTKANEEMTAAKEKAERDLAALEKTKRDATLDIEGLKRKHLAELAERDALTEEQRTRATQAEEEKQRALTTLAAKETELGHAEAGIQIATEQLEEAEAKVAEKQALLIQAENASLALSNQISEKNEQLRVLASDKSTLEGKLGQLSDSLDEIGRQLEDEREKSGGLGAKSKGLEDEIAALKEQMKELQTKLDDCTAEQERLTAENNSLKEEQVREDDRQLAELRGGLAAAERQVADANAAKQRAEAELLALQAALRDEKAKVQQEKEKVGALTKRGEEDARLLDESRSRLEEKDKQVGMLADSKETYKRKAEELQAKYNEEIARHEEDLDKQKDKITAAYEMILDKMGASFNETLKQGSESAQQRIRNLTDHFEEQLNEATSEYSKLRKVVEDIATSIDTGAEVEVEDAPQEEALEKIISKLKGTPSSGIRLDSSVNHCYLVFLTSYLWRMVFGGNFENHAANIQYILSSTFRGGHEKGTHVTGLYEDFGCSKEKAHITPIPQALEDEEAKVCECHKDSKRECEVVYGLQETSVIKSYLEYIGKLLSKMVDTTYETIEETITYDDKVKQDRFHYFLVSYLQKLRTFRNQFPTLKPNKKDKYVFLDMCTKHYSEYFKPAQSYKETSESTAKQSRLQDKYLVMLSSGSITIETRTPKEREERPFPTQPTVNFAILFFTYIVLLRDYLNHVKKTGKDICPLPAILEQKEVSP